MPRQKVSATISIPCITVSHRMIIVYRTTMQHKFQSPSITREGLSLAVLTSRTFTCVGAGLVLGFAPENSYQLTFLVWNMASDSRWSKETPFFCLGTLFLAICLKNVACVLIGIVLKTYLFSKKVCSWDSLPIDYYTVIIP